MGLFHLEGNIVQIEPDSLAIPEMRAVWDRDKTRTKEIAYKELSYIYFVIDFKSPYQNIADEHREAEVIKDFIKDDKWRPDALVNLAIEKYNYLQETASLRLLKSARGAVEKLTTFFKDKNTDDRNYTSNLEKLGKIIESIDKLEEKVRKDTKSTEKIRGGGEINERER